MACVVTKAENSRTFLSSPRLREYLVLFTQPISQLYAHHWQLLISHLSDLARWRGPQARTPHCSSKGTCCKLHIGSTWVHETRINGNNLIWQPDRINGKAVLLTKRSSNFSWLVLLPCFSGGEASDPSKPATGTHIPAACLSRKRGCWNYYFW